MQSGGPHDWAQMEDYSAGQLLRSVPLSCSFVLHLPLSSSSSPSSRPRSFSTQHHTQILGPGTETAPSRLQKRSPQQDPRAPQSGEGPAPARTPPGHCVPSALERSSWKRALTALHRLPSVTLFFYTVAAPRAGVHEAGKTSQCAVRRLRHLPSQPTTPSAS